MSDLLRFPLTLLPALTFLVLLVFMDSFKLVPFRNVARALLVGGGVALLAYVLNANLLPVLPTSDDGYRRYAAPFLEEFFKCLYVVFLIRTSRTGFLVDTAVLGFAVGTGFSLVENIYYLGALPDSGLSIWCVRGFGTAIIHGSTTSIFGIVSKVVADRYGSRFLSFLPGFALAFAIHSLFNHFVLNPFLATAVLMAVLPLVVVFIFERSEKLTRSWLGVGFDSDIELLEILNGSELRDSKVGGYLETLKERFPGPVMGDLVCLLRVHLELSVRAKGILLARGAGLVVPPDDSVRANLEELTYLNKTVGPTGRLALAPFLNMTSRELWQLYMLGEEAGRPGSARG